MRISGVYVGLGEGDTSPEIAKIKTHLKRKYTPARNTLDDSELFTAALTAEVKREQAIFASQGKLKDYIPGVITLAFKYACGYLSKEVLLPLYFSVEGHMSDMWFGPMAWVGDVLAAEGRALHFPTAYNRTAMPFDNKSGVLELARRVGQTVQDNGVKFPAGTPWLLGGFSQGALITSQFYQQYLLPGKPLNWRLKDLKGALAAGNPYREKGVVAEWLPDPPAADRQGISDVRLVDTPSWWTDIARHGDLYTDNESDGDVGLYKSSVYKIVAENQWSGGPAGMLARVVDLLSPADDLIPVTMAIISGMLFLFNMSPHGTYDMDPAVQFMRERLAA